MTDHVQTMYDLAKKAWNNAYAPYSKFKVACCLRTQDGHFYLGCNVENAAYPLSQCAESSALGNMITDGQSVVSEVLIYAGSTEVCSPCGACRQKLAEFAKDFSIKVHMAGPDLGQGGIKLTCDLAELLPHAFTQRMLNQ